MKRDWRAAPTAERCRYTTILRDNSLAQCMKRRGAGDAFYCTQHRRIIDRRERFDGMQGPPMQHAADERYFRRMDAIRRFKPAGRRAGSA